MKYSPVRLKSPGSVICKDFPAARLLIFSRPDALNSMTLPMVRMLHQYYITAPHPNPDAIYVVRGDGRRSFCAGGDILALTDGSNPAYAADYFQYEYRVCDCMASMRNAQVAMWAGHVLGSGVGLSLHGRFRIACETTQFAMPETHIGAVPDVGTSWVFGRLPVAGMGPYLAITGNALKGADALYAGLATHYIPLRYFDEVERTLVHLRDSAEVSAYLNQFCREVGPPPPFTMQEDLTTLERAFGEIKSDTTIADIMESLQVDGSDFAISTLKTMRCNSPIAMATALVNLQQQRSAACPSLHEAFQRDFNLIQSSSLVEELRRGAHALLIAKSPAPKWSPATLRAVDLQAVRMQFDAPEGTKGFSSELSSP